MYDQLRVIAVQLFSMILHIYKLIWGVLLCVSLGIGSHAKVPSNTIELNADTFEIIGESHRVLASGNVEASYQKIQLSSETAVFNSKAQQLHMSGRVSVMRGLVSMTSQFLAVKFEKKKIISEGDVTFRYLNYLGKAGKATFETDIMVVWLEENPYVMQGVDTLRAEKIRVDLNNKKVKLIGQTQISVSEGNLTND